MSDNGTEEKKRSGIFTGIGRFFKTIGDTFDKKSVETDYGSTIPVDISPDIQEMPPVLNEYEDELNEKNNGEGTPFGDSLKNILATLSATEAKQKFVDFIKKNEVDRLTPFELETLDSAYHEAISIAEEKRKKYASFKGTGDIERIQQLLKNLKIDNTTPPFVKQEIVQEIIKELKANPPGDGEKIQLLINNYTLFLKRLDWEINGEKRIIDYTVKSLNKAQDTKERFAQLSDLAPYIQARIKDKKIKDVSRKLFEYMLDFYNQLNQRITGLDSDPDVQPDSDQPDLNQVESTQADSNQPGLEQPDSDQIDSDHVDLELDDNNLPDFGAEEDALLKKLAQTDDPAGIASEIDQFPEEKKADILGEIAFDPRFDRYFNEIIGFLNKEDIGKLIGMVIMRVKELERTQGRNVSTAYTADLINRLTHKLGARHIIVLKVKNIQHFQQKAYGESAEKLEELKRKIQGKSPYEQIQILKDVSEEPGSSAIFGAIQNLERITVETYFDEIFSGLPPETQKVVAEGLLSDLAALKKFYPHLITRLEMKLDEVTRLLEKNTYTPGDEDHDLISRIVDYANKSESGGGVRQDKKEKGKVPEEIQILEKEINALPSLNEKIATVRFWIENHYYSDKPPVELFLRNKLEDFEQAKAREGGLLRDIFDELREVDTIKEKINLLEEKLKDPLYFHLRSMIKTLIGNIANNTDFAPVKITEEWIMNQLKGIPDINRKIDWLRIRRYLVPFEEFSDFIRDTIERFETYQQEELQEELEEKIFGNMTLDENAGKDKTIYKNIIALTRAALSLEEKVQRRKLIKEQEILHPLDEQDRFARQRKLLYYLLNTQNDDIPALKLKVLADKVLLSFDEKKDYLSLLKLSRFKGGNNNVITLADELRLTNEDIAYYAVYILGCNRPGLEQRIRYIEDFRNGLVDVEGIPCPVKDNRIVVKDYREFFTISPPIIAKVLMDLKKKIPEKKEKQESKTHVTVKVDHRKAGEGNKGIPFEGEIEDTTGINEKAEEGITENTEVENAAAENTESLHIHAETEKEESTEGENEFSPDEQSVDIQKNDRGIIEKKRKIRYRTTIKDDESTGTEPAENQEQTTPHNDEVHHHEGEEEKVNESAFDSDTVYEKNKSLIDNLVQKRIIERGTLKSKSLGRTMRVNSENAVKKEEIPLSKRIARLFLDLSKCFPEAVPDIINRTIIPVFVESKNETGRDIFNAINQNIFIPILYNGAEVDIDSTVDSIESFLGRKGSLSESRKIIHAIASGLRKVRFKEIKSEVERKLHESGGTSAGTGKEPDNIQQVLRYLAGMDDPARIIHALDEKYILPLSGSTQKNDWIKKLHTLKSIISTSKSINWQKVGDYYGADAIPLLKQIKQRIGFLIPGDGEAGENSKTTDGNQPDKIHTDETSLDNIPLDETDTDESSSEINRPDLIRTDKIRTVKERQDQEKKNENEKKSTSEEKVIVPEVIEKALKEIPAFTDPHALILKIASKNPGLNNMFGKNRDVARQYVIDTLLNAGKIFSYDKKRYIGFGRIAHYLYDKKNKDYNRQALAQALFTFLNRFPGNALKAAFLGVEEKNLAGFLHMLEAWVPAANTQAVKKRITGTNKILKTNPVNKNTQIQQTQPERTKQTITHKNQAVAKKTIQTKTTPHIKDKRIDERRKTKTSYSPEKEKRTYDRRISDRNKTQKRHSEQKKGTPLKLSARGETMLKNSEKLITEKLILLIKLYNTRESLKMLYDSYLSPSSDKKNRLNLIDQKRHSAIYNAIKDDDAVLERLRCDVNKVMKLYHKKMSKVKK